jgi:hypothetical protein
MAEVSLVLPEGRPSFNEPGGSVSAADAGSYRARIHAVGRDRDYDIAVDVSWKAQPSPMGVFILGSAVGKTWPGPMTMWLEGV